MSARRRFMAWRVRPAGDIASHGLPTINARNGHKVAEVASHNLHHANLLAAGPALANALQDLLDTVAHVPFTHSFVKDERVCATCRAMAHARTVLDSLKVLP